VRCGVGGIEKGVRASGKISSRSSEDFPLRPALTLVYLTHAHLSDLLCCSAYFVSSILVILALDFVVSVL